MKPSNIPIRWQVLVQKWQHRRGARGFSPVSHEIHDHAEKPNQDHSRSLHSAVGVVGKPLIKGATGFGVGKDGVPFLTEGEREVQGA